MAFKEKPDGIREKTHNLTDHIGDLFESYYKLGVVNATDKATSIASLAITIFFVGSLGLFAFLFIGFGVGWWLGEMLKNMLAGFSIVAAAFVLLIGVLMVFRKPLISPFIRNIIVKKVYE